MAPPDPPHQYDRPPMSPVVSRSRRVILALIGLLLVGVAAIGAIVPVLPSVIFLIGASWCFTRSCPWLEERLLRARIFKPVRGWLEPGGYVSPRARGWSIAIMLIATTISAVMLSLGENPRYIFAGIVVALGVVGTWFIVRHRRGVASPPSEDPPTRPAEQPTTLPRST